ncbi:putative NIN-like transcription factor [Tribonema minus]|uniref:Putative NIN-like transcription factor n=1 Tax=Tribonema minus TaxID=303371 RepID=A0A835Z1M5_9STRA|nr:putative NIN-like transcription factor [Tribonema minus]
MMDGSMRHIEADNITLELLQSFYNVPLAELAKELGLSLTLLKKICRKYGIQRWPHRQIRSINKSAQELTERINGATSHEERAELQSQLHLLEKKKRLVTRGASSGLQSALRNALFLANPEQLEEDAVFDAPGAAPSMSPPPRQVSQPTPSRQANPMYKMMQHARSGQRAEKSVAMGRDAQPAQRPAMFLPPTSAAAAPGGFGGFRGPMAPQDDPLLQHQMATQMAQLAMQQQMQMNNYLCMGPAPQPAAAAAAVPPLHASFFAPDAGAADVSAFDATPLNEVAALLGMSDEELALSAMQPSVAMDFDADLVHMMLDAGGGSDELLGEPAYAQQPPQQLPQIMQTGGGGGALHAPPAAPGYHPSFLSMGTWSL